MSRASQYLLSLKIVQIFLAIAGIFKKASTLIVLPGFRGMTLYRLVKFIVSEIQEAAITMRASALAFNFFLALFPSIIFLFTLIPYVPIHDFQNQLLDLIQSVLPENAYKATRNTIMDIVHHQRGGLLSIGFISAIYFSTNGVHAMIEGFNKSSHITERRSAVRQRVIAIWLTLILSFLLLLSIALIIGTEAEMKALFHKHMLKKLSTFYLVHSIKWLILLALIFFTISIIYYYGPAGRKKYHFFSTGSWFASIMIVLTSLGFNYFVNNFGKYNKLYGSIGTLIVILLWLYFNSLVLLIGFDLNISIAHQKKKEGHK